jgi:hypothetical protein
MFRTFMRDVITRRSKKRNRIAEEIGITPPELENVLRGESFDQDTAAAICNWLNIPSSAMFTSEKDPMAAGVSICEDKVPDLIIVLRTAAEEVLKQTMTEGEFGDLVKYALEKIDGPDKAKQDRLPLDS